MLKKDQNVYFEFVDDYKDEETKVHNVYSFTEYKDVKADYVVDNICVGDSITITIENISGNFTYILIDKIEKNDIVIFDSIEHYQNHNRNLRLIFIPSIIILSLFLIVMCYLDFEKNNTASKFIIRNSKFTASFFIFSILLGTVIPVMFSVLLIIHKISLELYKYSFVFYLFLLLGILGITVFLLNYIKYDSNYYYIRTTFKKQIKINKCDIEKVLFDKTGNKKSKSGLYTKNDKKIIEYSFELVYYLSKEYFIRSLKENGTKFVELVLDNKGVEIEKEIKL